MLPDIEIARQARLLPISEIAARAGLEEGEYEPYGRYKAKVSLDALKSRTGVPEGKLIYVTGITPTPAGEGKTCTAVGLTQAIGLLGRKVILTLREPSLGPVFGIKGGAAGGSYAQVLPMEDINLHFNGDIHAVAAGHNLLAAMLDNHIYHGNELGIDCRQVLWRRVMDVADRQLRNIIIGGGGKTNGVLRESGFDIAVSSEIMAILCLSEGIEDLKERLASILVAFTRKGQPIFAGDLKAVGPVAILLKEAIKPNLVQTMEGQPAFIHGGPFANIAHGNNSVLATRLALKLADYVVTEGGFGSDLGAEKFFDIVAPQSGIKPAVAVLVVSVRALKNHGGVPLHELGKEDVAAVEKGLPNLRKHLANLRDIFKLPVVVAVNKFATDTRAELDVILEYCRQQQIPAAVSEVVTQGGKGGIELAKEVLALCDREENTFTPLYHAPGLPLKTKINLVATGVYGADGVCYTKEAERALSQLNDLGFGRLPVCIAKTQMSLSDNPLLKGFPRGWTLTVRDLKVAAGARFVVVFAGNVLTMPGLPRVPAAEKMDLLPDGTVHGLF